jgi:hypothetical protein
LRDDISALVEKSIKELELRELELRSRTKSLAEKERKIQQREQLLADKERTIDSKERSITDREKKLARDEKTLQEERKRHTDHVKSSLANLQQQKHESVKESDKVIAQLQVSLAEAASERNSLRDQLSQRDQNDHPKDGSDTVQLHAPDERPPEQGWPRFYPQQQQQQYETEPDHEEQEPQPQQQAPYYPPVHHIPYPMPPQQFHHPAFKYPLPGRGYPYQPQYFPMRGYAPGMYPPPGVFPPRHVEPRSEPSGEEENGENPEWRDQYAPQPNLEEDHQDRQRSHLSNYPGQPQYPPPFWGADSQ